MTWSAAGFGERQSQSWTFGRSRTGDKHLLSVLGRERNEGKQKEAVGSKVFLSFFFSMYEWTCRTSSQGRKENMNSYFWPESGWQTTPDFPIPRDFVPYAPEFYCLALTWARKKTKNKKHNQTHTENTALCFGTLGLASRCKVAASRANQLECYFERIQRSSVCARRLCTAEEKNAVWRATCQDQWRDGTFFPLSFPFSMSCWRGIWDAVSKGRLEELYFKIISCLKILEAFIAALLKALFKRSIRSTQTLGCCPV